MTKLYSEIIFEIYLDYFNNDLTIKKFAEHNLLSVEHAEQLLEIGRIIAYDGLKQYQQNQLWQGNKMANIQLIEAATIAECFICAIEYNDYSGLSNEEESQLNEWLENYQNCIFEYGDSEEFARCEITRLMGNCVNVKIYKVGTDH